MGCFKYSVVLKINKIKHSIKKKKKNRDVSSPLLDILKRDRRATFLWSLTQFKMIQLLDEIYFIIMKLETSLSHPFAQVTVSLSIRKVGAPMSLTQNYADLQ